MMPEQLCQIIEIESHAIIFLCAVTASEKLTLRLVLNNRRSYPAMQDTYNDLLSWEVSLGT